MNARALRSAAPILLLLAALPLAAQPTVRGIALDAQKKPLAGARAELLPVSSNYEQGLQRLERREAVPVAVATSDAAGRFTLRTERPGLFTVRISAPGKVALASGPLPLVEDLGLPPVLLTGGTGTAAEPAPGFWRVEKSEGEAPAGEPGKAVERRLRVVDPRGEPLGGILVGLGPAARPVGVTAADGRLTLPAPAGEEVLLRLLARDGRQAIGRLAAPAASSPPGGGAEETVLLGDGSPVAGRVVAETGGRPLAGALVWWGSDPGAFLVTDAEGRYSTRVVTSLTGETSWIQARAARHLPARLGPTDSQERSGRLPAFALARSEAVTGRVTDAAGTPLPGAWISAAPVAVRRGDSAAARRLPPPGASSATDGTFRLGLLRPGELYALQATLPGFLPATAEVLVPPPGRRGGGPVQLVLHPARPAFGRILDARRQPVPGAAVRLTAAGSGAETPAVTADAQGRFRVDEIPALAVDLEAAKPGFAPARLRNFKVPAGKGPVDLGTLTLHPGAAIAGVVQDARGKAIPGAQVFQADRLLSPFEMAERRRGETPDATTGADGRFSLTDLPRGLPVHLLVTAPGHLPATVRGVRPPTATPLRIRLDAGTTLAGRVLDPAGVPVRGADVELTWRAVLPGSSGLRTGAPVLKHARSLRDGRFEIHDIPAGPVTLGAAAAGFVAAEEVAATLPQAPGELTTIVLERGATLEGRVTTTAGDPVADARILAGTAFGHSDGEGFFSLDAVPSGQLAVEVHHPHYERFRKTLQIDAGVNHLDVVFKVGLEVRGRVVDNAGTPVAGAAVTLGPEARPGLPLHSARSDADGVFTLAPVAAGRYRLAASARGFADSELPETVTVAQRTVEGLEVRLAPAGIIAGRILGLEADELPRVEVAARQEGGESKLAEVDAAGQYVLRNLRAGDWLVRASLGSASGGQRQVQARVPLPAGGEEVRDLRFGGHLTLSGLVLYRGEPLADATVSLRGERLAVERSLSTDFEGRFRFEDLDADTYLLGLTHAAELLTHNQRVELAADRAVTIELERATVSGIVLDAESSAPLGDARVDLRHLPSADGPEFLVGGSSDESGTFRLERVPPGSYRLTVSREGYSPAERPLEVAADLANLEVPLQPAPGAEIAVRLVSGKVPGLLHLRLQSPEGTAVLTETRAVGADGILRLSTAPPGTWTLLAASPESALAALPLAVPGEPATLVLPDAAPLAVRVPPLARSDALATLSVTAAGGQPLRILGPGGTFIQQWQLVAGSTTVGAVPAGSWVVSATAPDGRIWTAAVATDGRSPVQISLE